MTAQQTSKSDSPESNSKVFALIGYLSILCIIPLLFKHDDDFVLYHSKQGLVLFLLQVAAFVLHIILGYWLLRLILFVTGLIAFLGMISILRGKKIIIPVISNLAEKLEI